MPFLAPIGAAILGTTGTAAATGFLAAAVGTVATVSAGLGIASGVKGLTAKAPNQPSASNVQAPPSVPTQQQAQQAAQNQVKTQQRRATKSQATSLEEQTNLLANPSTTKKTLLGQG
jgi:hypothetical protein